MRMRAGIFFFPGDGALGADRRDEEPLSAKAYRMGRCQTTLPLGQDLPREAAVELAAEEVEDVLGEQTQRGMAQQPPVEGAQGGDSGTGRRWRTRPGASPSSSDSPRARRAGAG